MHVAGKNKTRNNYELLEYGMNDMYMYVVALTQAGSTIENLKIPQCRVSMHVT